MKFLAQYKTGCQCHYCIGNPSPKNKRKVRKSQRSSARQENKKIIDRQIQDA